jgi:DHA2 family multidrug resistance protein
MSGLSDNSTLVSLQEGAIGKLIVWGRHNPWVIAVTVMLATFMEVLDTSIANVALPTIAGNLSASYDESTWVLTSYLVSNAIVLPLTPWLSSVFGRKNFYMTCVVLFSVSSLLCGMAPTLQMLVICRILQGVGGGALMPISQAILIETFPPRKQGVAMAAFAMGALLAPVVGPALGGWITENFSWRWCFLINVPVGLLALGLTALLIFDPPYLPRVNLRESKVDLAGLGLVATGLGFLQVVLDNGQKKDWFGDSGILAMTIFFSVCLIGAVFWEMYCKDPVVDLRLLAERNFAIATLTMFVVGIGVYGSMVLYPLYLQNLMGYSPTLAGLAISPGGLALVLTMPFVGLALQKMEARWLMVAGLLICALGLMMMSHFNLLQGAWTAIAAMCVFHIGEAMLFVPINAAAFAFVPKEKTNNGTGLMNLSRNIGGSVGIAMMTTILARRAQFHQHRLVENISPLNTDYRTLLQQAGGLFYTKGSDPVLASHQALAATYGLMQRQATMMAFNDAFFVLGVIFLLLVPLLWMMRRSAPGVKVSGIH